jgi:hypothetical protein
MKNFVAITMTLIASLVLGTAQAAAIRKQANSRLPSVRPVTVKMATA